MEQPFRSPHSTKYLNPADKSRQLNCGALRDCFSFSFLILFSKNEKKNRKIKKQKSKKKKKISPSSLLYFPFLLLPFIPLLLGASFFLRRGCRAFLGRRTVSSLRLLRKTSQCRWIKTIALRFKVKERTGRGEGERRSKIDFQRELFCKSIEARIFITNIPVVGETTHPECNPGWNQSTPVRNTWLN